MAEPEPLAFDTHEALERAILAQLSAATGTRATGTCNITAPVAAVLPANTYLAPVVGGQLREDLLFKTARDPSTSDGAWVFTLGQTRAIPIFSNLGGARHNLDAATVMRFMPSEEGFAELGALATPTTGGATGLIKSAAVFEEVTAQDAEADVFKAKIADFPGLVLTWLRTDPLEGKTVGPGQGATRVGRASRIVQETYEIHVMSGDLLSDPSRRRLTRVAMQAVSRLLTDRQRNIDGEQLSSMGAGVTILRRYREVRNPRMYMYGITIACNQTLQPIDERTFNLWLRSHIEMALPGHEAPEPTDDLTMVDVDVSMVVP